MGRVKQVAIALTLVAAGFGVYQAGVALVREYRAYRDMQQAVTLLWQYLDTPVGQRTLPDGTTAPVNRADVLALLAARAATPPAK